MVHRGGERGEAAVDGEANTGKTAAINSATKHKVSGKQWGEKISGIVSLFRRDSF